MQQIHSRVEPGELLHLIVRRREIGEERLNVSYAHQPLQVGCLLSRAGTSYKPHIHRPRDSRIELTQECWVVLSGEVRVDYYDLDGSALGSHLLSAGDVSVTYRGGHGYTILKDAEIVEVKNGPYAGHARLDKEFI